MRWMDAGRAGLARKPSPLGLRLANPSGSGWGGSEVDGVVPKSNGWFRSGTGGSEVDGDLRWVDPSSGEFAGHEVDGVEILRFRYAEGRQERIDRRRIQVSNVLSVALELWEGWA